MALPPKAKITALVWNGRRRPKFTCGSKLSFQFANSSASQRPADMPITPQPRQARRNMRTILSSYLPLIIDIPREDSGLGGLGKHCPRRCGARAGGDIAGGGV